MVNLSGASGAAIDTRNSRIVPMRSDSNSDLLCVLREDLGFIPLRLKFKTKAETAEDAEVLAEERRSD
jgi:hypothetical protein